ncbi:hypothetical protein ACFSO7_07155 [Bacillus sp. CGMCC 1.16607]|uniref:hypothetical protein n=1 Tax=Bacillus sp. CGMCC 1.16607 TaxID=3351842 RepID=UPI0036443EAF
MLLKNKVLDSKRKNALELIKEWSEELSNHYSDNNSNCKDMFKGKPNHLLDKER